MRVEWSDFRVLLALARAGSVAGAARELQVDQSTISRRLSALEEALDAKLLLRGGREFSWTAQGRSALQAAEAMEVAAAGALRAIRASKEDVTGNVRVSVAPAFMHLLLRRLIPELRQTHPQLLVTIEASTARVDLSQGDTALAVRMNKPTEPDLIARRAFDCNWFLYASQAYLALHNKPATHDELEQHALVLYAELLHAAPPVRWLETYKAKARATMRVDSVESACEAAAADGGIVTLPAVVGDAATTLRRVFPDPVADNTGWVVYHACVRDNTRVRIVADALVDFFGTNARLFLGVQPE
jgi:DNA-binding transcriptional LysR family regulator